MTKTVSTKMGIKAGERTLFVNAQADALTAIDLPSLAIHTTPNDTFDYIHLFITSQNEMHEQFPRLKEHLKSTGKLWVSWPKARQLNTDLTLPKVIEIGYQYGLVESTALSINTIWSALKFTHPKAGKTYHNKYGTLKT